MTPSWLTERVRRSDRLAQHFLDEDGREAVMATATRTLLRLRTFGAPCPENLSSGIGGPDRVQTGYMGDKSDRGAR